MPGVLGGETLSLEDVAEVPVAVAADDLGSVAVWPPLYVVFDLVVEAGPATAALELLGGAVESGVALAAEIGACRFVVEERSCARVLCASQEDHAHLLSGECVVFNYAPLACLDEDLPGRQCRESFH